MASLSGMQRMLPDGAGFELMINNGFNGRRFTSRFYLYSPSHPNLDFVMSRMLNAVIFVYPNKPFTCEEEAWKDLVNTGLLDLAEKEVAYIIMPLPVNGNAWSEDDLMTYYDSQYYLAGGDVFVPLSLEGAEKTEYERLVFNNLQYIIAEGDGATFVNNVLSQHAGRISGILTFGGQIDKSFTNGIALPAYLVNADRSAIDYYKSVNGIDAEEKSGVFINSGYRLKKVITAHGDNIFDAGIIADAWSQIFSRTTRSCFSDNVILNTKNTSEWVLMDRPNHSELGITRFDHRYEKLPDGKKTIWYDFVPDRVLANPESKVPLVIVLHGGGDDPIYQAESNGWTAKAAEQGFILISPDYPGATDEGENIVLNILEYARKTYPVDESRVYLSGFSMGGASTARFGLRNPEKFAAIAIMGAAGYTDDKVKDIVKDQKGKTDMPFTMIIGTKDQLNFSIDENGNMSLGFNPFGHGSDVLDPLFSINQLKKGIPDYAAFPYWGFPTEDAEVITDKNLNYRISYVKKGDRAIGKFVLFENAGHAHSDYYASLAWDFMCQFSR